MAITKMRHIKGSSGNHGLKRSIAYIMNPDKTEDGLLVWSNAGTTVEEIFDVMMDIKKEWGKTDKRQGYHFVISWRPGEVTKEEAFQIAGTFCERYLGDAYDYVYSVHTDQCHIHAHIVFNSVNRITGYKYRYEKGDWERFIQPVTDEVCREHGLPVLSEDRTCGGSMSYSERLAIKDGLPTLTGIVKADIDLMIRRSESLEDFFFNMRKLGYRIRMGKYVTYYPPGFHKGRRDRTLGEGYSREEIQARILHKEYEEGKKTSVITSSRLQRYEGRLTPYLRIRLSPFQIHYVKKFNRAAHYLEAKNPFAVKWRAVRKDAMEVSRIFEECMYLLDHDIRDRESLLKQQNNAGRKEKNMIRRICTRLEAAGLSEGQSREIDKKI